MIRVSVHKIKAILLDILENMKTSLDVANKVADTLLINEYCGYPSHGVMRIVQYKKESETGALNINARPILKSASQSILHIDGNRAFGALVIESIIENVRTAIKSNPMVALSVTNAHHLGRLNSIGMHLAKSPYNLFVIGFCNYLGGGARVAPPGQGGSARLCTNPMLCAFPVVNSAPFVLDMSTSVMSEGNVYAARMRGELLPNGILVDSDQESVTDPNALYTQPANATLAPLGFPLVSHKGYGLAVFVEAIVGVLGGAHSVCHPGEAGNGLFLLTLNPEFFDSGLLAPELNADIVRFCYQATNTKDTYRYPGSQSQLEINDIETKQLNLSESTYNLLSAMRNKS